MNDWDRQHREDGEVERVLEAGQPRPSAAMRSRIREAIAAAGPIRSRPPQLRRLMALYAATGSTLLALAGLGLAGLGPLGG